MMARAAKATTQEVRVSMLAASSECDGKSGMPDYASPIVLLYCPIVPGSAARGQAASGGRRLKGRHPVR